jgi:hypothetical protein
MSLTPLKDLVLKAANKFQLNGELNAALVINRANSVLKELFPEQLFQKIQVKRFKDDILWCTVTHPIVAQELQMKSSQLKEKINESFGRNVVKQIRSYLETGEPEEEHDAGMAI